MNEYESEGEIEKVRVEIRVLICLIYYCTDPRRAYTYQDISVADENKILWPRMQR